MVAGEGWSAPASGGIDCEYSGITMASVSIQIDLLLHLPSPPKNMNLSL